MRKVAFVTGGSRGIGKACVKALCEDGYSVIFTCKNNIDSAKEYCMSLRQQGFDAEAALCDVADNDKVTALARDVLRRYHRIDVLVCNAGISKFNLFTDISEDEWNTMFSVNVGGVYRTIRAFLPQMLSQKSGSIINISSMWGQVGASCEVAYSAAKGAINSMTKALAKEVGPSGIRVNAIAPGVIDTDMNAHLDEEAINELKDETPLERIGEPSDIANAVSFLASDRSSFITGQIIGVNGGFII